MFAKKSRKEARNQQLDALKLQRGQWDWLNEMQRSYHSSFNKRNAPIIDMQTNADEWLKRYNRGEDVASLNPAFARHAQESANAVTNSMNFVGTRMGDTAGIQDKGYQSKLQSVAGRQIARALGQSNMQALEGELQNQRGILMDTTNFLNADSRASFGMGMDVFGANSQIFNAATQRRQMEINRGNFMTNLFAQTLAGGVSSILKAYTGGMFGGGGGGGASGGGSGFSIGDSGFGDGTG